MLLLKTQKDGIVKLVNLIPRQLILVKQIDRIDARDEETRVLSISDAWLQVPPQTLVQFISVGPFRSKDKFVVVVVKLKRQHHVVTQVELVPASEASIEQVVWR